MSSIRLGIKLRFSSISSSESVTFLQAIASSKSMILLTTSLSFSSEEMFGVQESMKIIIINMYKENT